MDSGRIGGLYKSFDLRRLIELLGAFEAPLGSRKFEFELELKLEF